MTVAQMITFRTDRPEDVARLREEWEARTDGERTATWLSLYKVPGRDEYVQLVEFPDGDAARRNSALDATDRWASDMRSTVGELEFTDLELVERVDER